MISIVIPTFNEVENIISDFQNFQLSNTNDILGLLGEPSTKSTFDNDVWIYIERKQTQSKIKNLGRMEIFKTKDNPIQ